MTQPIRSGILPEEICATAMLFRRLGPALAVAILSSCCCSSPRESPAAVTAEWRTIPLVANGAIADVWRHVGWGGFAVDDGSLRTNCDPGGLGLLVYSKEKLGDCQIRVVFRAKEPRSNAGVFVRIADGILEQVGHPGAAFDRSSGQISDASRQLMVESSEREDGPWFAVHRGYEVQILDAADERHRTGAIYSLSPSSATEGAPGAWREMVITLAGSKILVDVDGKRVNAFDPTSPNVPKREQWFEPKREPQRPTSGYIGLQNHDPGDVVWFKEVSVRSLPAGMDRAD
jgi:hypothetical protein